MNYIYNIYFFLKLNLKLKTSELLGKIEIYKSNSIIYNKNQIIIINLLNGKKRIINTMSEYEICASHLTRFDKVNGVLYH